MFPVPAAPLLHLLFETLGVVLAMAYYRHLRANTADPISDDRRFSLLIAAAGGALIGSRLVGALEDPAAFFGGGGEAGLFYYFRSKTIVGGLVGGLFAVELAKKVLGVHHRSGDLYVYPLLIAIVVGRVGCFLVGVGEPTYGLPTDYWTGMDLGDGIPRHPTALYEIVFLALLFAGLKWLQNNMELRPGRLFMLFLTAYLIYRLAIGYLQPLTEVGGLGLIQWTCITGLIWYAGDELSSRSRQLH